MAKEKFSLLRNILQILGLFRIAGDNIVDHIAKALDARIELRLVRC